MQRSTIGNRSNIPLNASFPVWTHEDTALHPSMEEKGITMMRLHRLHLSSSPSPRILAISWPHSQRVSPAEEPVTGTG